MKSDSDFIDKQLIIKEIMDNLNEAINLFQRQNNTESKEAIKANLHRLTNYQAYSEIFNALQKINNSSAFKEILNSLNDKGYGLLHEAVNHGHPAIVAKFLTLGMDVNLKIAGEHPDLAGGTALHLLMMHNMYDKKPMLRVLLAAGTDPLIKNAEQKTAVEVADAAGIKQFNEVEKEQRQDLRANNNRGRTHFSSTSVINHVLPFLQKEPKELKPLFKEIRASIAEYQAKPAAAPELLRKIQLQGTKLKHFESDISSSASQQEFKRLSQQLEDIKRNLVDRNRLERTSQEKHFPSLAQLVKKPLTTSPYGKPIQVSPYGTVSRINEFEEARQRYGQVSQLSSIATRPLSRDPQSPYGNVKTIVNGIQEKISRSIAIKQAYGKVIPSFSDSIAFNAPAKSNSPYGSTTQSTIKAQTSANIPSNVKKEHREMETTGTSPHRGPNR